MTFARMFPALLPVVGITFLAGVRTPDAAGVRSLAAVQDTNPVVILETSHGEIWIELYPERAPKTVAAVLGLVRGGFYDEMLFHRVLRDRVIQVGMLGIDGQVRAHEQEPIESEADNRLINQRGTVAMARTDDPHSATTEFFINVRDNWDYNFKSYRRDEYGYAVFGEVVDGMDVVDRIADIPTRRVGPLREFPSEPVAIYSAYVLER